MRPFFKLFLVNWQGLSADNITESWDISDSVVSGEGWRLSYPTLGRDTTKLAVPEGANLSLACVGMGLPPPETMYVSNVYAWHYQEIEGGGVEYVCLAFSQREKKENVEIGIIKRKR